MATATASRRERRQHRDRARAAASLPPDGWAGASQGRRLATSPSGNL